MHEMSLRQIHPHGDERLPLAVYPVDYPQGQREILPCHWHEEFEIIYIDRGAGRFRIGKNTWDAQKGDVLFVQSRELHSAESLGTQGCAYHAVVFRGTFLASATMDACQIDYINPILNKLQQFPLAVTALHPVGVRVGSLIRDVVDLFATKRPGYELEIKGSLLCVLGALAFADALSPRTVSEGGIDRQDDIKKVLKYIEENFVNEIHINELASLVHLSRFHFCRLFKLYTGTSAVEFLNRYRVRHAATLLQQADTVMEAAMHSGYDNMSYFTLTFKRYMGVTPSEYKRLQQCRDETRAISGDMVGLSL